MLLLLFVGTVVSCSEDNSISAGASTLPDDDIRVLSDTFTVTSQLDSSLIAISLTPDSFLLGECETHFGTLKADILTQLACPEGFKYPNETAEVDSVCLYLYYKNWYGDGNSPTSIAVYEMDKKTLYNKDNLNSNIQLNDYCSLTKSTYISEHSQIVVPNNPSDSSYESETESYVPTIRIKLSNDFAKRFFQIKDFSSQKAFNEEFKGLYICTDFGGSNVLYINVMKNMSVDCDCCAVAKDPCMADIGILVSTDPIAIDQACLDLVYASDDPGKPHLLERIESRNGALTVQAAAELGIGSREYELIEVE